MGYKEREGQKGKTVRRRKQLRGYEELGGGQG